MQTWMRSSKEGIQTHKGTVTCIGQENESDTTRETRNKETVGR